MEARKREPPPLNVPVSMMRSGLRRTTSCCSANASNGSCSRPTPSHVSLSKSARTYRRRNAQAQSGAVVTAWLWDGDPGMDYGEKAFRGSWIVRSRSRSTVVGGSWIV